jgi:hypothetical protein
LKDLQPKRDRAAQIRKEYPYYRFVPKEKSANLRFRKYILDLATEHPEWREELWIMCKRDPLFYFNTFGYVYDPRAHNEGKMPVRPFITYDFQDVAFEELFDAIDTGKDIYSEKSRDMGLSWMCLLAIEHRWHFYDFLSFRLISRNENLVDDAKNPDALFWKLDHWLKYLPNFLKPNIIPKVHRTHMSLINPDNGSTINGCATTGDVTVGGRCTAMLLDEFALVDNDIEILTGTRDVTRCRIVNSTHRGTGTAFYKQSKKKTTRKLTCHWSVHETKNVGLYYFDGKKIVVVNEYEDYVRLHDDRQVMFPDDYPFVRDGKLRSPWYDVECERAFHPMDIARELDIDPFASDSQFFDVGVIDRIEEEDCEPPLLEGYLEFECDEKEQRVFDVRFVEEKDGPLKLWFLIGPDGMPPPMEVAGGIDISTGTGASNSCSEWGNMLTHEKVAEYVDPWIAPEEFAKQTIAMTQFFNEPYLIWDGGGPGGTFSKDIVEYGYRNFYFSRAEERLFQRDTDKPGFFLNPKPKRILLGAYKMAMKDRTFIQKSSDANAECMEFVYTNRKTVEHSDERNNIDPSGAGDSHGDRVVADALLNKAYEVIKVEHSFSDGTIPANCPQAREDARLEKLYREENGIEEYWDE